MATIKGSNRSDKLSGTKHSDVILGRGGHDRIDGGKGDDLLFGGSGKDKLDGGKGNDYLFGGSGNDKLKGGKGDDFLFGGSGNDRLEGGKGNDFLFGGSGKDKLEGGKGNDFLFGGSGNDRLEGGKGNDFLAGGSGHDKLEGGKGNDFLFGGSGHDRLDGGKGDDTLVGGRGGDALTGGRGMDLFVYLGVCDSTIWDWDRISDFRQGEDKIDLSPILGAADLNWGGETPTANGVWFQSTGCSTLVFVDADDDGKADMKIELKNTGGLKLSANDFLGVSVGSPLFTENDDFVDFNKVFAEDYTGGTQYNALGGNDIVTLPVDASAAAMAGFDLARSFSGGAGDDRITMYVTNPLGVDGGLDNDTLVLVGDVPGNAPNDVVVVDLSAPDQVVSISGIDDVLVQTGFENVDASGVGSSVNITGDSGANVIVGSHGDDVIDGGDGNDVIAGGPGNDTIKGGGGDDLITMLVAAKDLDEIDAGDGNDTLFLRSDDACDVVVDMSGNDQVYAVNGNLELTIQKGFENLDASGLGLGSSVSVNSSVLNAIIIGSSGADMIFAFGQGSTVLGGAGDDTIMVTSGNNTLSGGPGNDQFLSGAGADTFKFSFDLMNGVASSGDGFDEIFLFGTGSDVLRFDFAADAGWDAGLADGSAKLAYLEGLFVVDQAGPMQTSVALLNDGTWSVTVDVDYPGQSIFNVIDFYVNGDMIMA